MTDIPVIQYRCWSLVDQKITSLVVLTILAGSTYIVYLSTGKPHLAFAVCMILLLSVWRLFVPTQFEWTIDGVTRWTFGRSRVINWSEIRSFVIQENGILILPHRDRYPLDAFRGIFIPVPKNQKNLIHRRFLFFMEKTV